MKRAIALVTVLALLPSLASAGPSLQKRIQQERTRQQEIARKLHAKRAELNAATYKVQDLQGQLHRTNAAIAAVSDRLDGLSAQERSTQRRMAWNAVQLAAAQKSLHLHDDLLKRRLVDIYENGRLGYLNVLLSARSFDEFVERWEDLRLLIAANQHAVRERKAAERKVAAVQADLERSRLALQQQEEAQQRARTQLGMLADERRNLVALADDQRRGKAVEVAQLEDLSAAQEAQLEQHIRELQAELAAQAAARRRAAGIAGVIPPPNAGAPSVMTWPVTGPITSPFGYRRNPFGGGPDFHPGIDIGVNIGTTVVAAASGTVIMAQWYGGYGNYVLIDNGGGISTGYGHLSSILVSVGQQVQRGQAIALSGNTGASTGPHLHFEVRRNGKPIDPAPWLH